MVVPLAVREIERFEWNLKFLPSMIPGWSEAALTLSKNTTSINTHHQDLAIDSVFDAKFSREA